MGEGDARIVAQRRALQSLAVWSMGDSKVIAAVREHAPDEILDPPEAYRILAEAIGENDPRLPRLIVLDLLVRMASRRKLPPIGDDDGTGLGLLLTALARQAGDLADVGIPDLASRLERALTTVTMNPREAWAGFASTMSAPMHLTSAEYQNPPCDDTKTAVRPAGRAALIQSKFMSELSVPELAGWADPKNWPHCNHFFESMEPMDAPVMVADGWDATFCEVVDLLGEQLSTPLFFQYRARPDGTRVRSTFRLVAATPDILVDDGYICIEHIPTVTSGPATSVSAVKAILFAHEPLASMPTIACDTYWGELMKQTALSCGALGYP